MNSICYFEILSSHPEREILFYRTVFGWEFEKDPGAPIPYYRITTDETSGALMARYAPKPAGDTSPSAFVISFEVSDFDAISERILQNGGAVSLAKFAVPGRCWQGYFQDPDGNVFGLFQVDYLAS